jgi:ABC-type dipeptide/oligopeptide/nickel transport system permease subunit
MSVGTTTAEKRPSRWRRVRSAFSIILASRVATIGLCIILFWILVALFAPLLAPHDPLAQDSNAINQQSSETYPLGTDYLWHAHDFGAGPAFSAVGGHRWNDSRPDGGLFWRAGR